MNEKLISYIWFNKLYYEEQETLLGESVKIVSPGIPNADAGPDVFNAKIQIEDKLWAGNVEFHVRSSDWHRHKHDFDPLYSHIVLHVVFDADEQIFNDEDKAVPTIILRYPKALISRYNDLMLPDRKVCSVDFSIVDTLRIHQWTDRLLTERLQQKVDRIKTVLAHNHNNWEQAFYVTLARAFGFGVNSDAMQAIAESIDLNVIMHHRDNIEQIEALLLGQAGLLDNIVDPDEQTSLWIREYRFLRTKFSLKPADGIYIKFLRMRPYSFPTIRLAQLSMLLFKQDSLLSLVLDNLEVKKLHKLFSVETSDYWKTHFKINVPSEKHGTKLSPSSVDILIINTIVPFVFHYAAESADSALQAEALDLLRQLKPELNHKTLSFINKNFPCENAYDSQALIQLYDNYCMPKDCLRCQIGHQYLKHI